MPGQKYVKALVVDTTYDTDLGSLRPGTVHEMPEEKAEHLRRIGVVGDTFDAEGEARSRARAQAAYAGATLDANPAIPASLKGLPVHETVPTPDFGDGRGALGAYRDVELERHRAAVTRAAARPPALIHRDESLAGVAPAISGEAMPDAVPAALDGGAGEGHDASGEPPPPEPRGRRR